MPHLIRKLTVLALTLLTLAGSGVLPAAAAPGDPDYDTATAQGFVEGYAARHSLPGASYVVVHDGRPVTVGGTGNLTPTTPASVGSLSKSFTAFAVLQLVDQGRLDLDSPVVDHLPGFTVRGADPGVITVRMLLSHTSGLPNPTLVATTGSLADDVAAISELSVSSPPGTSYAYSNLNYRTLALLVEVLSGQPFDSYLRDHVFEPLGMHQTTSVITAGALPGLDAGHVTAYGLAIPLPELAADVGGSGGVISTAEDMGAWLAMQQRGGTAPDRTRLLSAELVEQSHTRQPAAGSYGFGWQHTSTADPARIGHDGSLTRYSAREDLVPSNGYAVAVLLDSFTPTQQHPFALGTGLIDVAEGETPEVGAPVATLIDLALGALTLLVLVVGTRQVRGVAAWTGRRRNHPWWRRIVRLVPQAVMPAVSLLLFVGLTLGRGNPATPVDVFGLWPAAAVLVLVAGVTGVAVIVARLRAWPRSEEEGPDRQGGHDGPDQQ